MLQTVESALATINDLVWGPPMLLLLFGTHVWLTVRLGFVQRRLWQAIKLSFQRSPDGEGDVTPFQSVSTALAATIGAGNIVGVGTAIAAGGPGAVLWIWLTGVFGIATKYAEAVLAVKYRVKMPSGMMAGGPMYVLERALGMKKLAVVFAALTAVAGFGIGNMVQANSIADLAEQTFGIGRVITGVVLSVLTAFVILGGLRSIARACELLVPFMAVGYTAGCVLLLVLEFDTLGETIVTIVSTAFTGQAAVGGFVGAGMREAMRYGVARGLFSNEAGLGSAPIVAAAAQTRNPVRQGLVSASGVFWDTVVGCAITGLVLVNSGHWTEGLNGAALSRAAFEDVPVVGPAILVFGLFTFVFATIVGWSYYSEKGVEYLFGDVAVRPFRWLWVIAVFFGSVLSLPIVWSFADIANALMAIPNLIALLMLSGVVAAETQKYLWSGDIDAKAEPTT